MMTNDAEVLEQLVRARARIARLEATVRCLKDGRRVDIPQAIQMAQEAVGDALAERRAVTKISSWLSEQECWEGIEVFLEEAESWPAPDPEVRDGVCRILETAARQIHEFGDKFSTGDWTEEAS